MKLKFVAGMLLACLMILTISCQIDDNITKETHKHSIVRESRLTLQDLEALPNAIKIINRINGRSSDHKKKNVYNEDYDFFVNTDNILRIDNGNYHSLTFPVFRFEDNGYTENLVLSEDDNGDYTAYLYTYDLTLQEKSAVADGKPTLITNKIKREKINFDSSQVTQRMIQIWYTEVIVISCGDNNYHNATNFGLWHQCIEEKQPQVLVITRSVTIDDGDSGWIEGGNYSGGSSSGGGTPTYNPNIPPFDPDKEMGLVKGNITKPLVLQGTPEQNFYNNDLSGENEDLRFVMNNSIVRIPILQYLQRNGYSSQSRNVAVEILKQVSEGNINPELAAVIANIGQQDSTTAEAILEYLTENEYSENSIEAVENALDDVLTYDVPPNILLLIDKPCQNGVIKDLLAVSSPFIEVIQNTFNTSDKVNLEFINGTLPTPDGAAFTLPLPLGEPDNYLLTIKFADSHLEEATDLAIVATALHEMVHAYLIDLYLKDQLTAQNTNYDTLMDAFLNFYTESNQVTFQELDDEIHNAMADFMQKMANSIYNYAQSKNINVSVDYCIGLAWSTMYGYDLYNEVLTPQQKLDYAQIGYNEQNNTGTKKGSKCP